MSERKDFIMNLVGKLYDHAELATQELFSSGERAGEVLYDAEDALVSAIINYARREAYYRSQRAAAGNEAADMARRSRSPQSRARAPEIRAQAFVSLRNAEHWQHAASEIEAEAEAAGISYRPWEPYSAQPDAAAEAADEKIRAEMARLRAVMGI